MEGKETVLIFSKTTTYHPSCASLTCNLRQNALLFDAEDEVI